MKIIYKKSKNINPKKLLELFQSVGWAGKKTSIKDIRKLANAYKNSSVVISAWEGDKLVGIIKGLTDKILNGIVFGLVVHKDYQKQGIGKKLFLKCVGSYPKITWFVSAEKGAEKFYEKLKVKKDKRPWFEYKAK